MNSVITSCAKQSSFLGPTAHSPRTLAVNSAPYTKEEAYVAMHSSVYYLASFPGRRRNGLETSASSNCIRMYVTVIAIALLYIYIVQLAHVILTIFPAVKIKWGFPAVRSTTEVKKKSFERISSCKALTLARSSDRY